MNISEKLCLLRVKQGLSYGRLGQLAQISPTTYLQWEQGIEPTKLKLGPVLELLSKLYDVEISEKDLRDDKLALRFDKAGKPFFARQVTWEETPTPTTNSLNDPARPETLLEYEGIYSRLRVTNQLTEKEAQMLVYLVKGFLRETEENGKDQD